MTGQPATRSTRQVQRETFNQLLAAANRRTTGSGPLSNGPIPPAVGCLVKWTGAALPEFSIVGVGDSVLDPDDRPFAAGDTPIFEGAAPALGDAIAITREPCPAAGERLLRAVLLGVAEVDVDVTDAGHTFAAAIVGDTAKLESAASGPVRILHKPAGTGVGRCVVLVGPKPIAGIDYYRNNAGPTNVYTLAASSQVLTVPIGTYLVTATMNVSFAGGAAIVHFGVGVCNEGATPSSPKIDTTPARTDGASGAFVTVTIVHIVEPEEYDDDGGTPNVDIKVYKRQTTGTGTLFDVVQFNAVRLG